MFELVKLFQSISQHVTSQLHTSFDLSLIFIRKDLGETLKIKWGVGSGYWLVPVLIFWTDEYLFPPHSIFQDPEHLFLPLLYFRLLSTSVHLYVVFQAAKYLAGPW